MSPEYTLIAEGISAGIRLLQRMGWRQGKGVGAALAASLRGDDAASGGVRDSRWGRVQGVGVDNTPIYMLPLKQDAHGLGFDPFQAGRIPCIDQLDLVI